MFAAPFSTGGDSDLEDYLDACDFIAPVGTDHATRQPLET